MSTMSSPAAPPGNSPRGSGNSIFSRLSSSEKAGDGDLSASSLSSTSYQTYFNDYAPVPPPISMSPAMIPRLLCALIPSFIQTRLRRDHRPEKIHPTAYLDGMRGIAAFAVFICHYSYQCFVITTGYGAGEPGENNYLLQLPFIRLFYSGPPAVAIFFVISGFALSFKPVKQMRAHTYDGLMETISSAVFRRALRLYLPCFASTLLVFCLVRIGFFDYTRPFYENRELLRGQWDEHAPTLGSTYEQFRHWSSEMFEFVHPWSWGIFDGSTIYDRHLWTIPTEFRASMVLFLTQVMVARLTPFLRIVALAGLISWGLHWDRWEMALFWCGTILAELDQMKPRKGSEVHLANPEKAEVAKSTSLRAKSSSAFWILNFVSALYLASYPDALGHITPGYASLTAFIPDYYTEKHRFWQSIGAVQLVWATNNHDGLKSLFTVGPVQYLGKISFALYLMHGVVIHTFGYAVMPIVWACTGVEDRLGYELGFLVSGILITAVLIWTSDLFWRAVDLPSVRFARWLETKCIVKT